MQATCWRQKPRRINPQPNEMKTVLMALNVAFVAGKSEIVIKSGEFSLKCGAAKTKSRFVPGRAGGTPAYP